jgi:hypothetical protein
MPSFATVVFLGYFSLALFVMSVGGLLLCLLILLAHE